MTTNVFALINNKDEIIEYPVFLEHIINRGGRIEDFVEVEYSPEPITLLTEKLKEIRRVVTENSTKKVLIHYVVEKLDLYDILAYIEGIQNSNGNPNRRVFINDIPVEIIDRFKVLLDDYIDYKLTRYANKLGYHSIERLASWKNSNVAAFSAEATAFITIMDKTWVDLLKHTDLIYGGQIPMYTHIQQIDTLLPPILNI